MHKGPEEGFLNHLLKDLDGRTKIRIGREFLVSEIKDLFYQAYYQYLQKVTSPVAEELLHRGGITPRQGYRLVINQEEYHLEINSTRKKHVLKNIDHYFTDEKGCFNPKGYYDEVAIERFNQHVFAVFDRIVDEEMELH
ncbi:MAG: hypothetical protein JXR70_16025 [Spirochaetales bacterium]|nr:hypothetical protein [Spirochaetales bacterium]